MESERRRSDQKKWKPEKTVFFLEEYSKHPCLWDPGHPDYKDGARRQGALLGIAFQMKGAWEVPMGPEAVKAKIRVLRNTYTNELKKRTDPHYKTNLRWFLTADRFLRSVVKVPSRMTEVTEDPMKEEDKSWTNEEILHPILETQEELEIVGPDASTAMLSCCRQTSKRKLYSAWPDYVSNGPVTEEDEFDLFGRNVALQMRKLPELEALELQADIQRLITEKRIEALRRRSEPKTEFPSSSKDAVEIKVEED